MASVHSMNSKKDSEEVSRPHPAMPESHDDNGSSTEKAMQPSGEPESPKEDFQAWVRVLGAWLLFIAAWGPPTAYGAFELYYTQTLLPQYSASTTAWVGSLGSFLLLCAGVLAGPFFDRGYLKLILVIGCFMMVFGLMMLSLSTEFYQVMLSQGVCFSIGAGLVYVPALSFVTSSFTEHRAYAVGVTTTGASIGGVVYPIMFIKLIPQIGFGWTCRVFGFFNLGLCIIGLALVWSAPVKQTKPRSLTEIRAFTEPAYLMLAITFFLQFLAYWIPIFYIPTYATSALGSSSDLAIYAATIFNAASVFGRLLPSVLIKRFGAINIVFLATIATTIIFFCWIAVESYAGFVVWCVMLGFTSGVFISGNPVIVSHPQISSLDVIGTRLGQLWVSAGAGALIGTPIAGTLVNTATGDFLKVQIFVGCILLGAVLTFLYPLWKLNEHDKKTAVEK